jgi:hypothetical protein
LTLDVTVYEYYIWTRPIVEKSPSIDLIKIDITDVLHKKKKAIQCYKSQITNFIIHPNKPVLKKTFFNYFYHHRNKQILREIVLNYFYYRQNRPILKETFLNYFYKNEEIFRKIDPKN